MGQVVLSRTWNRDVCRVARHLACVFCVAAAGVAGTAKVAAAEPDRPTATELGLEWGPETTVISEPRTADGYPDYAEFLNRRMSAGIPKEENFWAAMWVATGNIERSREPFLEELERRLAIRIDRERRIQSLQALAGVRGEAEARLNGILERAQIEPWKRTDHAELQLWLEANDDVLAAVTDAARRPSAYMPVIGRAAPRLMLQQMPHLAGAQSASRMLIVRAMRNVGDGELERAWQDLLTVCRIAGHVERREMLFDVAAGRAIRTSTLAPLAHWLARAELPADELEKRRLTWSSVMPVGIVSVSLEAQRFEFLERAIALKSGECPITYLAGSDEYAALNQLVLDAADLNIVLREGNRIFDALEGARDMEPAARRDRIREIVTPLVEASQRVGNEGNLMPIFLRTMLEGQDRFLTQYLARWPASAAQFFDGGEMKDATRRALMKSAFLARTQMASGGPTAIVIDGSYPPDPFSGVAIRSLRREKQLVLYSVGPDGEDDRGQEHGEGPGNDDIRVVLDLP